MRFNFTCLQSTAYYSMQAVLVTSFSVTLISEYKYISRTSNASDYPYVILVLLSFGL